MVFAIVAVAAGRPVIRLATFRASSGGGTDPWAVMTNRSVWGLSPSGGGVGVKWRCDFSSRSGSTGYMACNDPGFVCRGTDPWAVMTNESVWGLSLSGGGVGVKWCLRL